MGRWLSADLLASLAPDWSPYRYGFNNPIFYSDPLGLFETEASAKEYAKENGIKTGWFRRNRIKEQEDGSFAIENKNGTNLYDYGDELGGVRKEYTVEANSKEKEERDIASRQLRKETVMMITGMVSMPGGSSKGASRILPEVLPRFRVSRLPSKKLIEQADELVKLNKNKNSVTIRTSTQQIRYDLAGKAHGGVPTPHKQIYQFNIHAGKIRSVTRASKTAEPMTQAEIRMIRKYLEK